MSDSSNIEWTDATWNPVVGCSRVSAGCDHCYAVGMTRRLEGMSKAGGFGLTGNRKEVYRGLTIELPQAAFDKGCGVNGRHFNGEVRCVEEALSVPLGWKKPKRIFVNSMSDLFHPKVPFEFIDRVFAVMLLCRQHKFQILTKRPERMAEWFSHQLPDGWEPLNTFQRVVLHAVACCNDVLGRPFGGEEHAYEEEITWPSPNVWLGTSCEDQAAADERVPHLIRCPATVRFLSCEPLLGPIDLDQCGATPCEAVRSPDDIAPSQPWRGVDWVIVGGESGPRARSCDVDWIRSIVRQCREAAVPCFVKQMGSLIGATDPSGPEVRAWGETRIVMGSDGVRFLLKDKKGGDPAEWPEDLRVREFPKAVGGAA